MTRDPNRPTVQPKPIGAHPHAGQLAVVISFRLDGPQGPQTATEHFYGMFPYMLHQGWEFADLDVAVRVIGAAGEASEHEQWPPGSARLRTEDDIQVVTTRDADDVPTEGRL